MTEVDIRAAATMDEHEAVSELFAAVWKVPDATHIYPAHTLRALDFSGNYVAAAFIGDRVVAAAVGYRGGSGQLHSDVAGVAEDMRGRGIGRALKLHQRTWALQRGIESIQWTFDPALFRNARFNIHRLGAHAVAFLPDFYGPMDDGLNAGTGPSDRLLVDWRIDSPRVRAAMDGRPPRPDGGTRVPMTSRLGLRAELSAAFAAGLRITDVTADRHYIMEPSG